LSRIICLFLAFLAYLGVILQILPQLKTFFKNLSAPIILVLDASFVANLTFLGLLSREISFKNSHPHRHAAYFAIREPQCSTQRNMRVQGIVD